MTRRLRGSMHTPSTDDSPPHSNPESIGPSTTDRALEEEASVDASSGPNAAFSRQLDDKIAKIKASYKQQMDAQAEEIRRLRAELDKMKMAVASAPTPQFVAKLEPSSAPIDEQNTLQSPSLSKKGHACVRGLFATSDQRPAVESKLENFYQNIAAAAAAAAAGAVDASDASNAGIEVEIIGSDPDKLQQCRFSDNGASFFELLAEGVRAQQRLELKVGQVNVKAKDAGQFTFGTNEEFVAGLQGMIGGPKVRAPTVFVRYCFLTV